MADNASLKAVFTTSTLVDGNEVKMKRYADGGFSFATDGSENFVYLHPTQVEVLRAVLDIKLEG